MNAKELVKEYLRECHAMQLSTCIGNQPWTCTVSYVADDNLNLYWASLPSRRHSKEIEDNPKASVAVVAKAVIGEPVIGMQFEGTAQKLEVGNYDDEVVKEYAAKFKRSEQWVKGFMSGNTEHRLYKFTPSAAFLFDEQNFPGGKRQQVA